MTLNGHIDIPATSDHDAEANREERERSHLRALFWVSYVFDKEIALRTSQPPFLTESYCDLTPPCNRMTHLPPDGPDKGLFSYLHGDIGLSHLKGKANRLLYSAQASRKSDPTLLRDIRELDSELEEWRLSLPANVRPSLSISLMSPPSLHETQLSRRMRIILVHLEYFYLMIATHHASGRCTALDPQVEHLEGSSTSVLDTSLALCLEASRSTIIYLKAMVSGLATETFWVIQFYPTVAIITLFLNILINPLDNQAHLDLELLSSAAEIFRFMPMPQHTPRNLDQVQMLEAFVVELTRLGRCA
ncbi:transcriptional activator Mut3p, partial [Fusarium albosuccineum]